ncbi:15-hydroxyprostaglandin dehydrogenase [NAD(+)]-like [Glandiceps talaboti]
MELVDKVAIVTGGAEGIGKAISERLLQERCKGVIILDNNEVRGKETEQELSGKYGQGRTIFISCDVTSKSDLEDAFHKAKTHYQGLDIVCNNAGIQDEFKMSHITDAVVSLITDCDSMNGAIVTVLSGEQPIRTIDTPDYELNI